ncbi:hypothetical protein LCGC14_2562870 [marine sediment metagenome]|uniref:Uncharacterized protein n=1 Tax=marine sediment metagenome TaxID=412755 RepID=A0A0F9AK58_9ZZZZ
MNPPSDHTLHEDLRPQEESQDLYEALGSRSRPPKFSPGKDGVLERSILELCLRSNSGRTKIEMPIMEDAVNYLTDHDYGWLTISNIFRASAIGISVIQVYNEVPGPGPGPGPRRTMTLIDYILREALGSVDSSPDLTVTLTPWEALGMRPRPPLGYQRPSGDLPKVVIVAHTRGES